MDDQLNLLPLSSHVLQLEAVPKRSASDPPSASERQLTELRDSLQDTQPVGALVGCCRTTDQVRDAAAAQQTRSETLLPHHGPGQRRRRAVVLLYRCASFSVPHNIV